MTLQLPSLRLQNRPLGYQRNQFDLTANYRINTAMSLRGGYRYDAMSRDYQNAEREDTEENTLFAKWKMEPHAKVDLSLNAEASSARWQQLPATRRRKPGPAQVPPRGP